MAAMEGDFLEFVYKFYKSMKKHEIKLAYEGPVTQQVTKAFTALAETQMTLEKQSFNIQRKVFHVMVECLQNISRYANDRKSGESNLCGRGIFMVSRIDQGWCVTTGNTIVNEKVEDLRDMIDQINELDKQELKDLYLKKMQEGGLSDKGGAGLGFIDIRRKTGKQLEYRFLPMKDNVSFFLLSIYVPQKS